MTINSTPRKVTRLGLVASLVLTMLGAILVAPDASAQADRPTLAVSSHVIDDSGQFTALVSFDPAGQVLGALSAQLDYNPDALTAVSCTMGDLGVCNPGDDTVSFAAFATRGFVADSAFVAIEFSVVDPDLMSDLVLTVETTATVVGAPVDGVLAISGTVVPAAQGGLNGEVRDLSGAGVFGLQVCAVATTGFPSCTVTTGLGAFVIEGLPSGDYSLVITDPNGLLETHSSVVTVAGFDVTTGIEILMTPPGSPEVPGVQPPPLTVPQPDEPTAPVTVEAGPNEIVVQVTAAVGDFPVFGASVCATMPLIGTQSCNFTDVDGIARLSDLGVGNYELSASDPAGRFGAPESVFVGLNRDQGIVSSLVLPAPGLGTPPQELAFVDRGADRSEGTGLAATGLALAAMSGAALVAQRRG